MKFQELRDKTDDLTNFEAFKNLPLISNSNIIKNLPQDWKNWLFIQKAKITHENKYDYSKVVYKSNNTKVVIICPIHERFSQRPADHLNKIGCPKCGKLNYLKKNRLSTQEFIKKAVKIHENKYDYSKIEYINHRTKITIVCPKHGDFQQTPNSHLKGRGCPHCGKLNYVNKNSLTTKQFIQRAVKTHGDKYNYSEVNYKNTTTKITIVCPKHGDFQQTPYNHTKKTGCPICNESKGEGKIAYWLNKNHIKYKREHTFKNLPRLRFDFYLPDHNLLIEFDGIQHFKPIDKWGGEKHLIKIKHRDRIKNQFVKENSIKLVRISYGFLNYVGEILEFILFSAENNFQLGINDISYYNYKYTIDLPNWIFRKNIIKSMAFTKLGITSNKIYARKCEFKKVSSKEASKFFRGNHLHSGVGTKYSYGLYYDSELVCCLSMKKHLKYQWEIHRLASIKNTIVVGGFSKLLKQFIVEFRPETIFTYADADWTLNYEDSVYYKNEFKYVGLTEPSYKYYNKTNGVVLSRQRCQKHKLRKLFPKIYEDYKTESQIMAEAGFTRINNTGNYKFIWTKA